MIPPRVEAGFANVPKEITNLCSAHLWEDLVRLPQEGMRSIRGILVHMVSAEAYWIDVVIKGASRQEFDPRTFASLDSILRLWTPQRDATLAFIRSLGRVEWLSQDRSPGTKKKVRASRRLSGTS